MRIAESLTLLKAVLKLSFSRQVLLLEVAKCMLRSMLIRERHRQGPVTL